MNAFRRLFMVLVASLGLWGGILAASTVLPELSVPTLAASGCQPAYDAPYSTTYGPAGEAYISCSAYGCRTVESDVYEYIGSSRIWIGGNDYSFCGYYHGVIGQGYCGYYGGHDFVVATYYLDANNVWHGPSWGPSRYLPWTC